MKELERRKIMRQLEIANAADEPAEDEAAARQGANLKKQSQFAPTDIDVTSFIKKNYGDKTHPEPAQKKSQTPAFGRKSDALNLKS